MTPSPYSIQECDQQIRCAWKELLSIPSTKQAETQDLQYKLQVLREQRAELARAITLKRMEATA